MPMINNDLLGASNGLVAIGPLWIVVCYQSKKFPLNNRESTRCAKDNQARKPIFSYYMSHPLLCLSVQIRRQLRNL